METKCVSTAWLQPSCRSRTDGRTMRRRGERNEKLELDTASTPIASQAKPSRVLTLGSRSDSSVCRVLYCYCKLHLAAAMLQCNDGRGNRLPWEVRYRRARRKEGDDHSRHTAEAFVKSTQPSPSGALRPAKSGQRGDRTRVEAGVERCSVRGSKDSSFFFSSDRHSCRGKNGGPGCMAAWRAASTQAEKPPLLSCPCHSHLNIPTDGTI